MLAYNIIRPSMSPYSAPVVLVKKKTGELRFCVDYRKLNAATIRDMYPIPRIEDIFDNFFGARYFTTLDLFSGYWQIKMASADVEKTAFTCEAGHFEFLRLPFGLCNAPASFQRLMNFVLKPAEGYALVYLDDIIIYSHDFEDHRKHLRHVCHLLREAGLKIKPGKCEFVKQRIIYLGHIVSPKGISPNPKKIEDVLKYPPPKNVSQLRTFLGLANYYRRFVKNFAQLAHPLTELTKKTVTWAWGTKESNSFNALKNKLTTAPILGYPDVAKGYILHTDASEYGVGAVLSQVQESGRGNSPREVVIAYTSKHLLERERRWATVEKELYAIVHAVKAFFGYVYGREITVFSDHKPLEWIMSKKNLTGRLCRWSLSLQQFNLVIKYRPGKANQNADTLSRIPVEPSLQTASISLISASKFPSKSEFVFAQTKDEFCLDLLAKGGGRVDTVKGLITLNGKIVVPLSLRSQVIERFHDHRLAGHLGIAKTLGKIKARYIWPRMRQDVYDYIQSCLACVKRKPYGVQTAPLQPIAPPTFTWQRIAMDVVGPLPETYNGNRYILVMSEYSTRYMIGVAMPNQKASTVANALIINVILRYGSPTEILTDRGTNFCSKLLREICGRLNIKQTRTTAYHPATDGNVERFNRTMGDMLATTLTKDRHVWDEYFPYVIYVYNTSIHSSTGETPHYLLYGQDPIEADDISSTFARKRCVDDQADHYFKLWRNAIEMAKETFRTAQLNQKRFYDVSKTKTREFTIGDYVVLKDMRLRSKFDPRWLGPYLVTRRMGNLNYAVKLDGSTDEFIVHVNRMKPLPRRENTSVNNQNNPEKFNETVQEPQNAAQVVHPESQLELARFSRDNLQIDEGLDADQESLGQLVNEACDYTLQCPTRQTESEEGAVDKGSFNVPHDECNQRVIERKMDRPLNPNKRRYNKGAADVDCRPRSTRTPYNLRATARKPDRLGY